MRAIDRIMRAYSRTHTLTDDQQQQVRAELSKFIHELLLGKRPAAAELRDNENAPIGKVS